MEENRMVDRERGVCHQDFSSFDLFRLALEGRTEDRDKVEMKKCLFHSFIYLFIYFSCDISSVAPFDGNKSRVREQSSSETTAAAEGDVADDDKIHGDFKGGPDPMSVETEPEIDSGGCPK